jgi:hypothetical protein
MCTRKLRAQLVPSYNMPAKRKVETTVTEDSESAKALPTTADMADVLRKKPIKRRKRSKKKHPVWKHIDIDFDATHLMPEAAPFPELPRELRDEIYHWLWIDAAQIRQRYKGWHYPVTYGEQDAVGFQDVSSSKVCRVYRILLAPSRPNGREAQWLTMRLYRRGGY